MVSFNNPLHPRPSYFTRTTSRILAPTIVVLQWFAASLYGQTSETIRFANIGDYGYAGQAVQDVSDRIRSWIHLA